MASISVLHIPGTEQVASAKTAPTTGSKAPQSQAQATPSVASPTYHSPRIEIDPQLDRVIIQFVNSSSGLTNYQVPTKSQLAAYEQSQAAQTQVVQANTAQAQTGQDRTVQAGTQQTGQPAVGQAPAPQAPAPQPPLPQAPIPQPAPTGQSAVAPASIPATGGSKGAT